MGLLIRTLLVWLLVLAVPAQGVAAATMAFCGAGHAQHTAVTQDAHDHHHMAIAADDEDAAPAQHSAHGDKQKHKCSACASCCSASAMLSTPLSVPAPATTPAVFSALAPSVDAFTADGPDRPPRIALG